MSKFQRILNLFSPKSIHYIQPYWKKEQWNIALHIFKEDSQSKFSESTALLESDFSNLCNQKFSLSTNLGRSAIQIALESFALPPKSEVILPSFSCSGVILPVFSAGLTPVLVDIDQDFNILAASVLEAISPNTRAIIIPHLSGKLANDFFEILDIARQHNLRTIVDASQSLGLKIDNKDVVNFGDIGVFSFNGGKLIPSSSGGLLVSNDETVISFCKSRSIPSSNIKESNRRIFQFILKRAMHRFTYPISSLINAGHNFSYSRLNSKRVFDNEGRYIVEKINPIEAALAQTQLKFIPEIIEKRQQNAYQLLNSNVLQNLGFQLPGISNNVFTKFLVTHENPDVSKMVRRVLIENGIETEQSYTPLTMRELSRNARKIDTPNTNKFWKGAFSIPINPLTDSKDMDRIIHVLKNKI